MCLKLDLAPRLLLGGRKAVRADTRCTSPREHLEMEWDLFKPASATQGLDLPAGLLKLGRITYPCSCIK